MNSSNFSIGTTVSDDEECFDATRSAAKTFWITRTAPGNHRTAEGLTKLGHISFLMPVLEIIELRAVIASCNADAIVFSSANAVRMHNPRSEFLDLPVFAVGDHTASEAMRAGYRNVYSADGDVRSLEKLIRQRSAVGGRILHLSARDPAGDLLGALESAGYRQKRKAVYESRPVTRDRLNCIASILDRLHGIVIHSPKAGSVVAAFLRSQIKTWEGSVYCISPAAAFPFDAVKSARIFIADHPSEESMIRLIADSGDDEPDCFFNESGGYS
ncbi:uroporphyrinogen-III synthase [Hyphococcus luteus]|uniref:Uroporphyrinogen-III synthase n=1 Tax=Hyphococcus luteus TaxID=2058213 RepID=A0A2S7KB55_9PROT|nr:uroporphyrinogen-III synthase [Marinicaulis flavus]PQA89750.1 hypothetical protein CW354_02530 [Marinicaulis flavus]